MPTPPATPTTPTPPTEPSPAKTSETIRYSIGGSKTRSVEVIDGKAVVADQRTADTLNAAVDHVTFTTEQEK